MENYFYVSRIIKTKDKIGFGRNRNLDCLCSQEDGLTSLILLCYASMLPFKNHELFDVLLTEQKNPTNSETNPEECFVYFYYVGIS